MLKRIFATILFIGFALNLPMAVAGTENGNETKTEVAQAGDDQSTDSKDVSGATADMEVSVMDRPVDFSTQENIEKSMDLIKQEAGEGAVASVENAMKYILYYDLSVGHNKDKMYKKLNGRTPKQIIAKGSR